MRNVIAIDGPSGVGKSSVSKGLASRLSWTYLDTGAMYRTVTLAWLREKTDVLLFDDQAWLDALELDFQETLIFLGNEDVSAAIREPQVTAAVSQVAANPKVRTHLTTMQREIAQRRPCILDGRDIGTVVFPNAFFKVFLTASAEVRAKRRWLQMGGQEASMTMEQVLADQEARDEADSNRETAPLRKADDAYEFSTDLHTQDQVVDLLEAEARRRLG